ncbi:preprotein translocase subunit SecE [Candidatus Uhrbacteria bacterium]|nr:preprotein translocase subunit SecE [Candidatus Uhrbacteria bacterium]MBI4598848.1 preprotein translocase subunit SecE [Candidatus Uhrbacteria bacterium]
MQEATTKRVGLVTYLRQSREELAKVTWPSQKEVIRYSLIVIGVSAGLAVFIGGWDWALNLGLDKLIVFTR